MANKSTTQQKPGLWRKPITLSNVEEDPLEALYTGKDAIAPVKTEPPVTKSLPAATAKSPSVPTKREVKTSYLPKVPASIKQIPTGKISEKDLKTLLRIPTEEFNFTDVREILRGKSFEIYAYLRQLSEKTGSCKIKHLDLMQAVDISRPTLFKQGDWLSKLGLIKKSSVPGDHFGTTYTVFSLESALPLEQDLLIQFEQQLKSINAER